jgi:hypothetical protein
MEVVEAEKVIPHILMIAGNENLTAKHLGITCELVKKRAKAAIVKKKAEEIVVPMRMFVEYIKQKKGRCVLASLISKKS